jgi:hypothetical protein
MNRHPGLGGRRPGRKASQTRARGIIAGEKRAGRLTRLGYTLPRVASPLKPGVRKGPAKSPRKLASSKSPSRRQAGARKAARGRSWA